MLLSSVMSTERLSQSITDTSFWCSVKCDTRYCIQNQTFCVFHKCLLSVDSMLLLDFEIRFNNYYKVIIMTFRHFDSTQIDFLCVLFFSFPFNFFFSLSLYYNKEKYRVIFNLKIDFYLFDCTAISY